MNKLNMKTMKTIKLLGVFFMTSLCFTSCSNDDDNTEPETEEEVITTITYTLTNGDDIVTLKFQDLDGDGSGEGTYEVSGPLSANTVYAGTIELLNETESPAEDITKEIAELDKEHEFFFSTDVATISKDDTDPDGNPVGLETTLTTTDAGSGSLTIILRHEPTKPNDGTAASAGGSTDVEVTFSIDVE